MSLTGLADHPTLGKVSVASAGLLGYLKEVAQETARKWEAILHINIPTAITAVKPSGTVSQLVWSASGMHARYAPYYIRTVRTDITDPITQFLRDKGVPCHPEVGQDWATCSTVVFDFPVKAPSSSVLRKDRTAIQQLEYWKMIRLDWCEHNPSCTIYVRDNEWLKVGAWVYEHWDIVAGLLFLPYDGGIYQLAPYEEITQEQYEKLAAAMPKLDFAEFSGYERSDTTLGSWEYACTGGSCDL